MNLSSVDLSDRFTGALKSARIAVNTGYIVAIGYIPLEVVGGGGDGVARRWCIGKLNCTLAVYTDTHYTHSSGDVIKTIAHITRRMHRHLPI